MNYNDQILENKAFNFFKQLMYNIALSICLILLATLLSVWIFKLGLYRVESDSEAPYFYRGDMVAVVPQDEYKVGDIITFKEYGIGGGYSLTTHRYVATLESNGKKYYICHGDAVQSANPNEEEIKTWQEESEFIQGIIDSNPGITLATLDTKVRNCQYPVLADIEGEVIFSLSNYGTYITFIRDHAMLFIVMIAGIWVVSTVIQNEIEMKRSWRLM
ncbi:MAG: S24/S26 family peptidase [Clostridia bacterium]|nr:S24/S26 family peptidase [Clostridia bacterium]